MVSLVQASLQYLMHHVTVFGLYFDRMKRSRATFKLALRYCKNHVEELKADPCAESLFHKDPRKFWNSVYKLSNSKATCHVNSIGGASGAVSYTHLTLPTIYSV